MIRWIRSHRKLTATILGAAVQFVPGIDDETKRTLAAVLISYVVGQGVADVGKEKAKIEIAAGARSLPR